MISNLWRRKYFIKGVIGNYKYVCDLNITIFLVRVVSNFVFFSNGYVGLMSKSGSFFCPPIIKKKEKMYYPSLSYRKIVTFNPHVLFDANNPLTN